MLIGQVPRNAGRMFCLIAFVCVSLNFIVSGMYSYSSTCGSVNKSFGLPKTFRFIKLHSCRGLLVRAKDRPSKFSHFGLIFDKKLIIFVFPFSVVFLG